MQITRQNFEEMGSCKEGIDLVVEVLKVFYNRPDFDGISESIHINDVIEALQKTGNSKYLIYVLNRKIRLIKSSDNFTLGNYRIFNQARKDSDDSVYLTFINLGDVFDKIAEYKQAFVQKAIAQTVIKINRAPENTSPTWVYISPDAPNVVGNFFVHNPMAHLSEYFNNTDLITVNATVLIEINKAWNSRIPVIEQEVIYKDGSTSAWEKVK